MDKKKLVYLGASVGSIAGGYLPVVFGGSAFSGWSIIMGAVGGIAGIWLALRLG